jgi:signal peptidase
VTCGLHFDPAAPRRVRWYHHLSRIALFCAIGTLAVITLVPAVFALTGHRRLVVRSGSMQPAIMTGDVIVTDVVRPGAMRAGDVVTFVDSSRNHMLITHRVVRVNHHAGTYAFVTKGDANSGMERWSIGEDGTVGRLRLRVPKLGFVIAALSSPAALAAGAVLLLMFAARGWTREASAES